MIGSEQLDELETGEQVVLDKPIFIPVDWQASPDYVILKVSSGEIHWGAR